MGTTAAYIRVSSKSQTLDHQVDAVKAWAAREGVARLEVYQDTATGANMERPGWRRLEAAIRGGKVDRVVVVALDRLGRTLGGLATLFEELDRLKVELVSLREGEGGMGGAVGNMVRSIIASVAVFEREVRAERQKAGIASAKARGKVLGGRKAGAMNADTAAKAASMRKLAAAGASVAEIARTVGVSRTTATKIVRESAG